MGHLQQKRLRLQTLSRAVTFAAALTFTARAQHGGTVPIRGTTPLLRLQQIGRTTFLIQSGPATLKVPLKHEGAYPQGLNAPFAAARIAESPGRFLIFTDSFASNPGNVQGQCGASLTGERYLHVVALAPAPHETASALMESCWQNMVPAHAPHWNAATSTLTVDLLSNDSGPLKLAFHLTPEGEVTP